jgi:hypothetical protein
LRAVLGSLRSAWPIERLPTALAGGQIGVLVDLVVRTVPSNIRQPGSRPSVAEDGIAWVTGRALAG